MIFFSCKLSQVNRPTLVKKVKLCSDFFIARSRLTVGVWICFFVLEVRETRYEFANKPPDIDVIDDLCLGGLRYPNWVNRNAIYLSFPFASFRFIDEGIWATSLFRRETLKLAQMATEKLNSMCQIFYQFCHAVNRFGGARKMDTNTVTQHLKMVVLAWSGVFHY